jgi:hypothetical protein
VVFVYTPRSLHLCEGFLPMPLCTECAIARMPVFKAFVSIQFRKPRQTRPLHAPPCRIATGRDGCPSRPPARQAARLADPPRPTIGRDGCPSRPPARQAARQADPPRGAVGHTAPYPSVGMAVPAIRPYAMPFVRPILRRRGGTPRPTHRQGRLPKPYFLRNSALPIFTYYKSPLPKKRCSPNRNPVQRPHAIL